MFQGAGWSAHVLQDAHLPELQTLCEACPDYFILMDGHTASPDEAWRMMDAVPGDFDTQIHQKYVIGIRDKDERLIGVLEGVDGYPTTGTFYIGLLLVHPGNRGSGLAAEVITAFSEWTTQDTLRLAVHTNNTRAENFWTRLGFSLTASKGQFLVMEAHFPTRRAQ